MAMQLEAGREYAKWVVASEPAGVPLEVELNRDSVWHPFARIGDEASLLVAHPDTVDNPPGTAVLVVGRNRARIRAVDQPERVYRDAGYITVYPTPVGA